MNNSKNIADYKMRGICFIDEMFEAVIDGRKTVTRRMNRRYNKGEILYLKEPYLIDDNGFVLYRYSAVNLYNKRWKNKLFMPERYARYHIEITDVREERLQEITAEECFKEGIYKVHHRIFCDIFETLYSVSGHVDLFPTPQHAFAYLIDKINGTGTWDSNPVVTRYEFKLI